MGEVSGEPIKANLPRLLATLREECALRGEDHPSPERETAREAARYNERNATFAFDFDCGVCFYLSSGYAEGSRCIRGDGAWKAHTAAGPKACARDSGPQADRRRR